MTASIQGVKMVSNECGAKEILDDMEIEEITGLKIKLVQLNLQSGQAVLNSW